jgi:hypothetical protein
MILFVRDMLKIVYFLPHSNGIIISSSSSSTFNVDPSTLPRNCNPNIRVNPLTQQQQQQYRQHTTATRPQQQPQQQLQQPPPRPADNYCGGGLSPQLQRLTRTLKRSSDAIANRSNTNTSDSAYSTAADNYHHNGMTVSDENMYCEISTPAPGYHAPPRYVPFLSSWSRQCPRQFASN